MNGDANVVNALARFVRPHRAGAGHRPINNERGGQMPVAWWAIGAAISALAAWAMLRWVTLD